MISVGDVDSEENDGHDDAKSGDGRKQGVNLEVDSGVLDQGERPVFGRPQTRPLEGFATAQVQLLRHPIKLANLHLFSI